MRLARRKVPEVFTMEDTLKLNLEKQTRLPHARNRSKRREYSSQSLWPIQETPLYQSRFTATMSIMDIRDLLWESDLTQMWEELGTWSLVGAARRSISHAEHSTLGTTHLAHPFPLFPEEETEARFKVIPQSDRGRVRTQPCSFKLPSENSLRIPLNGNSVGRETSESSTIKNNFHNPYKL